MRNNISLYRWLFLILLLLCMISCVAVDPLTLEDPALQEVWPKTPEKPRIKLLRTMSGDLGLVDQQTKKNRFFSWLTGDDAGQLPLGAPYAVAADGEGLIWVTDPGNHVVHRFDLTRRRVDLLASVAGVFFQIPSGVAFDPVRRRFYVSDSGARRVYILSTEGTLLGEIGSDQIFQRPAGLAIDQSGNLLVADVLRGLVLRFTPQGEPLKPLRSAVTADGLFNRPLSVAVDTSNHVYVVDSLNFRIEVLDAAGKGVGTIGQLGDVPGSFSRPRGVAVDSGGHIYVSDAAFDNIQIFDRQGQLLLVFGSGGKVGLSLPAGLFVDRKDRIYAVDTFNHQLQIYQYLSTETEP